ncbi:MAG: helix-turn-helix domain-containing protein [Chloroflexota bacterium]
MASLLDEESLSVAEAAARLKVNKSTVWRWIDSGRLPAYRIGERRVRLKKADVEGLITPARVIDLEERDTAICRLTKEEQSEALAAVEQARTVQATLLARRGGERFSPSWELLEEIRSLRDRQQA